MPNFPFSQEIISRAMTYPVYKKLVEDLLAEGKVTGHYQSESMLHYARMNMQRMSRHEKTTRLPESLVHVLNDLSRPIVLLVITEGWCGDAAQIMPVVQKMTEITDKLTQRVLLRDDNPEIMDHYLTNQARSIPKFVGLDAETLEELFVWGSRPKPLQALYLDWKLQGMSAKEMAEQIHLWYARDKSAAVYAEFTELFQAHSQTT